ncbi:hypothetical protein AMEX_G12744 [Astyanax mexicanus]|uniref:THAP-type domain-containing protein n=1 Tax=Astyanax mexicanus TaxID=7994 RepID=A0A8T2LNZ4_ASTMX|nr:hypothetical protein AMEX_G12744 [Astyanax mexicanus]
MSSGSTCAVVGCHNNSKKLKLLLESTCFEHQQLRKHCPCPAPYALHSVPKEKGRSLAWLAALKLKYPPKRIYVCSFHFVEKKPTELHPDPELYLGYERPPEKKRRKLVRVSQTASTATNLNEDADGESHCCVAFPLEPSDTGPSGVESSQCTSASQCHSVHTQWEDRTLLDHDYTKTGKEKAMRDQMTQCNDFGYFMLQNDTDSLLYTGLKLETFDTLVSTMEMFNSSAFTMPIRDQLLLTLMKLKLNRVLGDLSRQFCVSQSMASKIISYWIDKLEEVLRPLIPWLPKETIQATMPAAFKTFPNVTCILDCSESLLQKPKNLDSRGESYSHYYSHNTVKYLVAVAPCGLIMFISAAYGGRCSDKFITMDCGILDYLNAGDEVMADRGFLIRDVLFERKGKLVMPSFTKKGAQLTEEQVTATRRIANVRIHVERAIRRLKVYKILSQVVPITMAPKMDKILRVCAALVNLRDELIRDSE